MTLLRVGVDTVGAIPVSMMGAGPLAALAYRDKVLGYGPIAYWMLAEAAGAVAIDEVNSPLQDGTHVGVTLGQPGIGDGETCPLYDGVNDLTNIYSATFAGAFDGEEGTLAGWLRVSGAGAWTDGIQRDAAHMRRDFQNRIDIYKAAANNRLRLRYEANNVQRQITHIISSIDWIHAAITWSLLADEVKAYVAGAQVGLTLNGLGVWIPPLAVNGVVIGSESVPVARPWGGWLAHCAVWDTPLGAPAIADLATV